MLEENELLIGKKSVLKTTLMILGAALALGIFTGKDGFNEKLFAIAFFALGVAGAVTIRSQVIISLCERFPEWGNKCIAGSGGTPMKFYLTPEQKAELEVYMQNDEQMDQLKKEWAFADKFSIALAVAAVVLSVLALVLA